MNKKVKAISLMLSALLSASAAFSLVGCKDEKENDVVNFFPIVALAQTNGDLVYQPTLDGTPSEKVEIPLLSGDIYTVCKEYEKFITDDYNKEWGDCYAPTPLTISWTSEETPEYYTLELSTNEDMSDAESYVTFDNQVTLSYLFMGYDYYYRIYANYEDRIIKSRIFEFSTEYLPRTVYVDEAVTNTRDWGGYYTADGNRVKQGIVYRGGKMDSITEEGKRVMLQNLGIKTDLDTRGDGEYQAGVSPLGDMVKYVETKGPYYAGSYGVGIDKLEYRDGLCEEIRVFADEDNFPIYVHCSLGRDRTGTICFLINALLGVGEEDLYRDYELSMMSRTGKDERGAEHMVGGAFKALYDFLANSNKNKTLQENAEAFMLYIGITQDEIDSIKENMLEK